MTFECKRCGKCCGIVPFNKKEFEKIRDYAKKHHIGFTKQEIDGKVAYFPKSAYKAFLVASERAHNEGRLIDNHLTVLSVLSFNMMKKDCHLVPFMKIGQKYAGCLDMVAIDF